MQRDTYSPQLGCHVGDSHRTDACSGWGIFSFVFFAVVLLVLAFGQAPVHVDTECLRGLDITPGAPQCVK